MTINLINIFYCQSIISIELIDVLSMPTYACMYCGKYVCNTQTDYEQFVPHLDSFRQFGVLRLELQ